MLDGTTFEVSKDVADAHPNGVAPWTWSDYVQKFDALMCDTIDAAERDRFIVTAAGLGELCAEDIGALNPMLPADSIQYSEPTGKGIFDWSQDA